MVSNECEDTSDCTFGDIVMACYEKSSFSDEVFFCECSNWYGWQGEDCDEVSIQLNYFRSSQIILSIWAAFIIIATARTLFLNWLYGYTSSKGTDPVVFTGYFTLFASFFYFLNFTIQLPSLFQPHSFIVVKFRVGGDLIPDVNVKGGVFGAYCLLFGAVAQLFATLMIIFSWYKVILRAARFEAQEVQKKVKTWYGRLKWFIVIYFLVVLILSCANELLATSLAVALTSIAIVFVYLVATRRFLRTLQKFNADSDERIQRTMKLVKTSAKLNTACLILIAVLLIVYYATFITYAQRLDIGQWNYVLFLRDLSVAIGFVLLTFTSWYVNSVTNREDMITGASCLSFLWRAWDNENERLLLSGESALEVAKKTAQEEPE